jgi:protein-tyrosine phosphatase
LDSKRDADASSASKAKRKVFIHCKAGRGRAATMALCYLIATSDLQPDEAMKLILSRRSVVEPGVRKFRVVRKFLQRLAHYDNDFDALYLHDGLLGGGN